MKISTRKLVNRFYYPTKFAERHQRPLRVNRHRKHFASWRVGFQYDKEAQAIRSYALRNGLPHWEHTTVLQPINDCPFNDTAIHIFCTKT